MASTRQVRRISVRAAVSVLITATFFGSALASARADVEITAQRVVSSGQAAPTRQALRLFYKGAASRLEVTGEPVLLYDGKAGTVYGVDPERKTYYLTVPEQTEPTDLMPPGVGGQVSQNTKLDLTPTNQVMTIAGQTAYQFTLTGMITFTRSQPQGFRRGGGHRRGGGGGFPFLSSGVPALDQNGSYGAAGQQGREVGGRQIVLPKWNINGDIWLSETLKFPSKETTVSAAQLAAADAGPFQQPLADALDKHKGLPLLARLTVTRTPALSAGKAINRYGGVEESTSAESRTTATSTTLAVQSVSVSSLSDLLFQAPLNYSLVAAPLTPYNPAVPPSPSAP